MTAKAPCACGGGVFLPRDIPKRLLEELKDRTRLTDSEVSALYARFRRLAPSGNMPLEQFRRAMGLLGLTDNAILPDRMFAVFDADEDGELNFFEFASSLAVMLRGSEDEKLKLSFEMMAGRRGAAGITREDFQRVLNACNNLTSSMVTGSRRGVCDEEAKKLFDEFASASEDGEKPIITLESYKLAARSSDSFLRCLGLLPHQCRPQHSGMASCGSWKIQPEGTLPTLLKSPKRGMCQGVVVEDQCLAPQPLGELRGRVEELRKTVLEVLQPDTKAQPTKDEAPEVKASSSNIPSIPQGPPASRVGHSQPEPTTSVWHSLFDWLAWPSCMVGSTAAAVGVDEFDDVVNASVDCMPDSHLQPATAQDSERRRVCEVKRVTAEIDSIIELCVKCDRGVGKVDVDEPRKSVHLSTDAAETEVATKSAQSFSAESEVLFPHSLWAEPPARLAHRPGFATPSRRKRKVHRLLGPKKGLAVHFGHENWNMVISMMIGIRMSIGRVQTEIMRDITDIDFVMKEKFSIAPHLANIIDSAVSNKVVLTRFIDYAPMVFNKIRSAFGIAADEYVRSVGPEQLLGNMVLGNLSALSELSSEGKSGAFFYYTADGKYMMKTVTKKEYKLLRSILPKYFDHLMRNPDTLLIRFLGLHCLSVHEHPPGSKSSRSTQKLYFVVMSNVFNTPLEIHRKYDLKGSWVQRYTSPDQQDKTCVLKDVDFTKAGDSINIGPERSNALLQQLESDTALLRDIGIIDYSLLVGIHEVGTCTDMEAPATLVGGPAVSTEHVSGRHCGHEGVHKFDAECPKKRALDHLKRAVSVENVAVPVQAATAEHVPLHQRDLGGILSRDGRFLYFLGMIDILTMYDSRKALEHAAKAMIYDRRGISCCPPVPYADRFNCFMRTAFT